MRKTIKSISAAVLCLVMVLGTMGAGGEGIAELISVKASASASLQTAGDIIEYGSYPQSLVTDEDIITSLNSLAGDNTEWTSYGYYSGFGDVYDGRMTPSDFMRYKDITLDGEKYRAVVFDTYRPWYTGQKSETSSQFQSQEESGYTCGNVYWFKYEPIQWVVLDPGQGLVMCRTDIDAQAFNNYSLFDEATDECGQKITWGDSGKTYYANNYEKSSIREWLNDDFLNTAFSEDEQSGILTSSVDNSACETAYSCYSSPETSDKIYLLSYSEATDSSLGFNTDAEADDPARQIKSSDYARAQGLFCSSSDGTSDILLRTAGCFASDICRTDYDGEVSNDVAACELCGIAPVMHLKDMKGYKIIEYGSYPQSRVTDEDTITALNSAEGEWVSYGCYSGTGDEEDGKMAPSDYMRYKDVTLDGEKYRAVVFDTYRPYLTGGQADLTTENKCQLSNGYTAGNVYWFKYEPLKWRVIDPEKGLVMCCSAIDSQAFNNYLLTDEEEEDPQGEDVYWGDAAKTYYANNYAGSSIREWLNNDFYSTAFSEEEQSDILTTRLDNSAVSTAYSYYDSAETTDKIYLLSSDDITNTGYQFDESPFGNDCVRQLKGTDYAKSMGIYISTESDNTEGFIAWLLRTAASYDSNSVCAVDYDGWRVDAMTESAVAGVVPAMNLKSMKTDTSVSDGDGTHTVYDKTGAVKGKESCVYTETTDKCTTVYTCCDCGYSYEKTAHTPDNAVTENFVPATASESGSYDEVTYCSKCREELSRVTKTIPVGFISASCDKTEMVRGETATFTVTTTTAVTWLKLNGTYTTSAGDVKTLGTYYRYNSTSNTSAGITVTDKDGIRTWTIPVALSYTVSDDSVTEIWTIDYKLNSSSEWYTAMTDSSDWSAQIVINRKAVSVSPSEIYDRYTLISTDTDKETASVGGTVIFTVRVTNDVTKVRIGYDYTADGASKTKAFTYQTSSSNVKSITDNGDGTSTWTISYKVPATAKGTTDFRIQVRGEAWGEAQTKIITAA